MPRLSAAAKLAIVSGEVEVLRRPPPPTMLTGEQALEWRTVVNRFPADYFPPETQPLLTQYCRHVCQSKYLGEMLEKLKSVPEEQFNFELYDKVLKAQIRESKIIASLSTKMRLSHSANSSMRTESTHRPPLLSHSQPWDTE